MGKNKRARSKSGATTPSPNQEKGSKQRKITGFTNKMDNLTEAAEGGVQQNAGDIAETTDTLDIRGMFHEIMSSMHDIKKDVTDLKSDMSSIKKHMKDLETSIEFNSSEITDLKIENKRIADIIDHTEARMDQFELLSYKNKLLKEEITKLEAYSKRDNLKFDGVQETKNENCEEVIKKILELKLQISDASLRIKIVRCHRLGQYNEKTDRPRTIIVKFHFYPERLEVWEKRRLLKGSGIFINEDFPQDMERQRKVMMPIVKAARAHNMKAYLSGTRLVIDDKSFNINTLHKLPHPITPEDVSEKQIGDYHFFMGRLSPLSNFSPHPIEVDGKIFSQTEQLFQYYKASHAGDHGTARMIMLTDDPAEQKRLGDKVKLDHKDWNLNHARHSMKLALDAKFTQHEHLGKRLKNITAKTIVECNRYDTTWANGLSLQDATLSDVTTWRGKNWLGELLMQVRETL
jgi:ribA/ribD-fused uncharacterized protein